MAELSGVELEGFRHALAGVAEEMGVALRRAAYSPNIKERADCSTAICDAQGRALSLRQMAAELTAQGIQTPRGGDWTAAAAFLASFL